MVTPTHFGVSRTLTITTGEYLEGSLYVELYDGDEPYTDLSVRIDGIHLDVGEFVAKTYSENEGMLEALVEAGAVRVVRTIPHALGTLPVCRLVG